MRSAGGGDTGRFEVGDAIAADLLASLAPLRFDEATDEGACEAAFRLRYRAIVERSLSAADGFPDGMERDGFDPDAVHIMGWDGERPIATCRLVPPSPARPLPVEDAFGLRLERSPGVVEWGRAVVDPDYRGRGVFMGLAARAWLAMRALGFTAAVGATSPELVERFHSMGFQVTVLSPPRMYWGEERCLILCDGRETIADLERVWGGSGVAKARGRGPSKRA